MRLFTSIRERLRRNDSRHVPGIVKSRANLAYSFIQQGEYLTAREQLLKALERRNDIRDPSVLNRLLELLWWTWVFTEQYRECTEFFSTYIESYPDDARGYSLRAASLWYLGELQQAIGDLFQGLGIKPARHHRSYGTGASFRGIWRIQLRN